MITSPSANSILSPYIPHLLSHFPAGLRGTGAVGIEDSVHGFDAKVAGTLGREHKGGTFDRGEIEACRAGAEDEGAIDLARHSDLEWYFW